ncbi:DUF4367 domain-containing protein [Dehalobacterium formicoaceticum]|uniref:DUF4367 domain-containing protein n=1 Tax=Dehalobacterium formicoaceticum TaxID=51515 RepID=A0ABT1Y4U9_9FIRM|nr:DUF4367 domain-containing protein [Dehalobacterium formicoaceticum]MCR6545521.1 DUF4367 domain-containing protein [Dehalobacterium formicoaceticum]
MEKNNLDDKLFDAMLKIAVEKAFEQEMDELPSCEEMNAQYKPSPNLDKRIRKLISRHRFNKKVSSWKKTAMRVAASAAIVIVVSGTILLSAEATRNYIFNAAIRWQEDHFSIQHGDNDNNNGVIDEKIYRPAYLPAGFMETSFNAIGDIIKITYENDSGMTIILKQSPAQSSHILVDHEDKKYSVIKINGKEAYLFETTKDDKNNLILWESQGIIFMISSEIESAELISMAESIQK